MQLAGLEPDDASARVAEREHEPRREVVAPAHRCEPGPAQLVEREPLLLGLRREPAPRREPEPELARDLLPEPTSGEVLAHRSARVPFPEQALEVRGGRLEQREQPLALAPLRLDARRGLLVLDRHAKALGEPLDRADEVDVLGLLHEVEEVAALAAAEAVEELVDGVDREARRPLLVERAPPRVARSGRPAQLRSPGDDLDHVGRGADVVLGGVLDPRHALRLLGVSARFSYSDSAYVSAKRSVMPAM